MWTTGILVLLAARAASLNNLETDIDLNNTLPAEQFFIDKIFDKYGDRGIITFEVNNISLSINIITK